MNTDEAQTAIEVAADLELEGELEVLAQADDGNGPQWEGDEGTSFKPRKLRVVTQSQAINFLSREPRDATWGMDDLAHTVATEPERIRAATLALREERDTLRRHVDEMNDNIAAEPDRTRAAVVKALRSLAVECARLSDPFDYRAITGQILQYRADTIKSGADWWNAEPIDEQRAAIEASKEYNRVWTGTWGAIANGLSSAARSRMSEEDVDAITHRVMVVFGMDDE